VLVEDIAGWSAAMSKEVDHALELGDPLGPRSPAPGELEHSAIPHTARTHP